MSFLQAVFGSVLKVVATDMSRHSLPQVKGTLRVPGLGGPVEVVRDRWGVPHIYVHGSPGTGGDDEGAAGLRRPNHDLFFAEGFVHAQDRLWQMEVNRRLAQGRLSELFGQVAFSTDQAVRTFGFDRTGRADWEQADAEVREAVEAYVEGANAVILGGRMKLRRPVEFRLLGHRPEPWAPEDVMAFSRLMIWELSHGWSSEIVRAQLIEAVGPEHAAEVDLFYPPGNPLTLPEGIEWNRRDAGGGTSGAGGVETLPGAKGPFLLRGQGSNSWVVDGRHTDTGHPYLCNDMHLGATLPGLWYEIHLAGGDYNVIGVSLPGVPGVMVGHNDRIAWGMTLAMTDCEDLYVEKFAETEAGAAAGGTGATGPASAGTAGPGAAGAPSSPPRYEFAGKWLEAEVVPEAIRVKGRLEPVVENVIITRHGPVIGHVVGCPEKKLALQSMALRPCPAVEGWLRLAKAGGWDDFVRAMRLIEAPQLNVTYADTAGNTGYWVTGKVPIRAETSKSRGQVPAEGWTGLAEWVGEVPFEEMPHALNPARGYVVSCNHRIVPDSYPYFLGSLWDPGYRARRVEDLLGDAVGAGKKLAAADFAAMHQDFTCLPGLEFVRKLEGLGVGDQGTGGAADGPARDVELALDLLRRWDGRMTPDTVGGTVYEVARHAAARNLFEAGLPPALARQVMGEGFNPLLRATNEFNGYDTVTLLRLLDQPDSWWVARAGGRETWVRKSLLEAIEWLRRKLGPDSRNWRWERLHRITFPHAMAAQPPLDRVFNVGPLPIGGDSDTVCCSSILPHDPYDNKGWAPTFRQIVDLGDLNRSVMVAPPGQSGQLGSRHYADLARPWLAGQYHPMLWKREDVEREAEGKLVLKTRG